MGNYEVRVCIINLDNAGELFNKDEVDTDEKFYDIACEYGTVCTLGTFTEKVNTEELDDLTNSYLRFFLVNLDNPNQIKSINIWNSLIVKDFDLKLI